MKKIENLWVLITWVLMKGDEVDEIADEPEAAIDEIDISVVCVWKWWSLEILRFGGSFSQFVRANNKSLWTRLAHLYFRCSLYVLWQ